MNILVLSAGTRNKIIQYFKKALAGEGNVIAADCQELAPALYEADKFYLVPRITDRNYIDVILGICEKEKVSAVLSLIDTELSLLGKNIQRLKDHGITLIGSTYEPCEIALNKYKMYQWLTEHQFPCARTYNDLDAFIADHEKGLISFPVFVKPVCGSASLMITKVDNIETVKRLLKNNRNFIVQEFLNGQEVGADVYVDMISHEIVSIFTKKKLRMRAGETDKAISFKDEACFSLIQKFVKEAGWSGPLDIDLFEINGTYYISEVNPRFGGGYPHAYECGCDHMKMIVRNLRGLENENSIGNYQENICMMKYSDLIIRQL